MNASVDHSANMNTIFIATMHKCEKIFTAGILNGEFKRSSKLDVIIKLYKLYF